MRSITSFVCQECGYESVQWLGKCPECGNWNSLKEVQSSKFQPKTTSAEKVIVDLRPKTLGEIQYEEKNRLTTGFFEVDNVFGGGMVPGSVTLLAGDPGIGKSTLLLQIALNVARGSTNSAGPASRSGPVLYISGEESEEQIKLRASRITKNLQNNNFLLLSLNNADAIIEVIQKVKPILVVIDSIQTMESENIDGLSGSLGQVRYSASLFIRLAKALGIPIILVGHVTKEGMVAGPMLLSHMVDVVLFLEGDKTSPTRLLRGLKNRFGPVDEVGVFVMEEKGLREVKNAEQFFASKQQAASVGSALVVTLEGSRAFLVEVQALVVFSKLPMPRRVASGIDGKRLELLLAVLQKHCRLPLQTMDVFVNAAGGIKLSDTACDLGICLAVFSSLKNIPLEKIVAISEVGLLGELRSVGFLQKRIKEAQKLGFQKILSPKSHQTLWEVIQSAGKSYG